MSLTQQLNKITKDDVQRKIDIVIHRLNEITGDEWKFNYNGDNEIRNMNHHEDYIIVPKNPKEAVLTLNNYISLIEYVEEAHIKQQQKEEIERE